MPLIFFLRLVIKRAYWKCKTSLKQQGGWPSNFSSGIVLTQISLIVQPESFESPIFKDSLAKVFRRDASGKLKMGLKSTLDIRV